MKNSLTGDEALTPEQSEAYHVALCQACECMNQGDFLGAHTIIREALAETREQKATRLIAESGTSIHYSDCATSIAPAEEPGPCDCVKDAKQVEKLALSAEDDPAPIKYDEEAWKRCT